MDKRIDMEEMEEQYAEKVALLYNMLWSLARMHKGIIKDRINPGLYNTLKQQYIELSEIDLNDKQIAEVYANNVRDVLEIAKLVLQEYDKGR